MFGEDGEDGWPGPPGEKGETGATGSAGAGGSGDAVVVYPGDDPEEQLFWPPDSLEADRAPGRFAFTGVITPTTIAADQNDYDPSGGRASSTWRLSTSGNFNITGIAGGTPGRRLRLVNTTTSGLTLTLVPESASSVVPGNRFTFTQAISIILRDRESVILEYDGVTLRWRLADRALPANHAANHTNGLDQISDAFGCVAGGVPADGRAGLVPFPAIGDDWKIMSGRASGGAGTPIPWRTVSTVLDGAIGNTADTVLARGASAWDATATIATDTSETPRALVQGNDRRLLHDLYKKRQMQVLPNFNATTLSSVGIAAATIEGTGVSQAIVGTSFFLHRLLANAGANSWRQIRDFAIGRVDYAMEGVWLVVTGTAHTAIRMWAGYTAGDLHTIGSPTAVAVAAFRYDTGVDTANTNWRAVTSNGAGGVTTTDTGVNAAVNAQPYRMVITTTGTEIKFYIDDVLVATHTTNLPTVTTNVGYTVGVTTLDASNKRIEVARMAFFYA